MRLNIGKGTRFDPIRVTKMLLKQPLKARASEGIKNNSPGITLWSPRKWLETAKNGKRSLRKVCIRCGRSNLVWTVTSSSPQGHDSATGTALTAEGRKEVSRHDGRLTANRLTRRPRSVETFFISSRGSSPHLPLQVTIIQEFVESSG